MNTYGDTLDSGVFIRLAEPDTLLSANDSFLQIVSNKNQNITLICESYKPLFLSLQEFLKEDILIFQRDYQKINEVTIKSEGIRKESDDTTHVVYFHFVNGQLFTIEKSYKYLEKKYLIAKEQKVKRTIPKNATFLYSDLGLYIQFNDSVFVFSNDDLAYLMPENDYKTSLKSCIGKIGNDLFYRNKIFYNLIHEYEEINIDNKQSRYFHYVYDDESFYFISQQYKNPTRGISLFYGNGHSKAGQRFTNREKISISKLNNQTGHLFSYLTGSGGFEAMVAICAPALSEGLIFGEQFFVFDLNKSIAICRKPTSNEQSDTVEMLNIYHTYKYKASFDYSRGKMYFLCRQNGTPVFLEFDCNTYSSRLVHAPKDIFVHYHWEINDGRIYFLLSDGDVDWQRRLYSVSVGDPRY